MAILVNTQKIGIFLNRNGPYLYFYDGKCGGVNGEIVKFGNVFASRYPKLKVFQVDWYDKITKHPFTDPSEMNKMYLYSFGNKIEEKLIKDKQTIDFIFKRTVECYNEHIEIKIHKQGSKIKNYYQKSNQLHPQLLINTAKTRQYHILARRRALALEKISIKHEKTFCFKNEVSFIKNYQTICMNNVSEESLDKNYLNNNLEKQRNINLSVENTVEASKELNRNFKNNFKNTMMIDKSKYLCSKPIYKLYLTEQDQKQPKDNIYVKKLTFKFIK